MKKPGIRGVHATSVIVDEPRSMADVAADRIEAIVKRDNLAVEVVRDQPLQGVVVQAPPNTTAKRPPAWRWSIYETDFMGPNGEALSSILDGVVCRRGRMVVISALELAELPDGSSDTGPQWHLSASFGVGAKRRLTDDEVKRVLHDFGMTGAEEDNHEPGRARHFWLPVDPARRVDCQCKTTEEVHVEPDGHRWTNPRDATPANCNACRLQRAGLGFVCPIHTTQENP